MRFPRNKPLPARFVEKYKDTRWVRPYIDGSENPPLVPNLEFVNEMPAEVYRDLITGPLIRPWQQDDGNPLVKCPDGMQAITLLHSKGHVLGYWFIDARIELLDDEDDTYYVGLPEILSMSPWGWPDELKELYPNAVASVFYPATHGRK